MASNGTPRASGQISGQQLADIRARIVASDAGAGRPTGRTTPVRRASPQAQGLQMPVSGYYDAKETLPNTPFAAAVISTLLGACVGIAATCVAQPALRWAGAASWSWARPQLGIYLLAWSTFHVLEFLTTAGWNYQKLSIDAFLLNNTNEYHLAHMVGLTEYFLSSYFWPGKFNLLAAQPPVLLFLVGVMIAGQVVRSLAMIHANASFSHIVKTVKLDDHTLITHGVYSLVRHPSYVGFFYWAVGAQLLLSNIVTTLGFMYVLGRFFRSRIIHEEAYLKRFFGQEYIAYMARVGSGLPFLGV